MVIHRIPNPPGDLLLITFWLDEYVFSFALFSCTGEKTHREILLVLLSVQKLPPYIGFLLLSRDRLEECLSHSFCSCPWGAGGGWILTSIIL